MIDINKAKEAFEQFVSNYDISNNKIKLKYNHTLRVVAICREIAISEGFNDEEVALAELIGLLHDIGRFEQIKRYNSYCDKDTIDHGNLGVEILFNDNQIRNFIESNQYDDLIRKTIYCHNKAIVPKHYNNEEKLYTNLVRDADKLDILYIMASKKIEFDLSNEKISEEVIDDIINRTYVDRQNVKTDIDQIIVNLSFVYDLNFPYSYNILREKNYVNEILDLYNFKKEENIEIFKVFKELLNNEINKCEEVI